MTPSRGSLLCCLGILVLAVGSLAIAQRGDRVGLDRDAALVAASGVKVDPDLRMRLDIERLLQTGQAEPVLIKVLVGKNLLTEAQMDEFLATGVVNADMHYALTAASEKLGAILEARIAEEHEMAQQMALDSANERGWADGGLRDIDPSHPVEGEPGVNAVSCPPGVNRTYSDDPNPNTPISDFATSTRTINVPDSFTVADVNVRLNISHTWVSDLEIHLIHGTTDIILVDNVCGSSDNFTNTNLDDEAGALIGTTCPPGAGTFRPSQQLTAFDGLNATGGWTLTVNDNVGGDVGTINDWTLTIAEAGSVCGACCTPSGCVPNQTPAMCTAAGGVYQGNNTECAPGSTYTDDPNPNTPITDVSTTNRTLTVADSYAISDLNVRLNFNHTWVSDLEVHLIHGATDIILVDNVCGSNDNFVNLTLDDESGSLVGSTCGTPVTGTFRPSQMLTAFDGQNINGAWTLRVFDQAGGDVGTINDWSLIASGTPLVCPPFGACCLTSSCQVTTQSNCLSLGGTYLGNGTACTGCNPTGACCTTSGCSIQTAAACASAGGFFQGVGTVCPTSGTYSTAPGSAINDLATTMSNLTVPDSFTITDVNFGVNISHTWVGDLTATLTHGATSVQMIVRPGNPVLLFGCSSDNYVNLVIDDEGTGGPIETVCGVGPAAQSPPSYTPNNPLSAFDGQNSSGIWTLSVSDGEGGDTGTLHNWSITLAPGAGTACPPFGACCIGGTSCQILTASQCAAQGGSYRGDNTTCPGACQGGCCTTTGCTVTFQGNCTGTFAGLGTTCTSCTGACCLASSCQIVTAANCAALGGSYAGNGTTCASCTGACCLPNGQCTPGTFATQCTALGGFFNGAGSGCPGPATFSATPNLPINDLSTISHTITVPGPGVAITDVNIGFRASHTWSSDLIVSISHNGGPVRSLIAPPGRCGSADGYNIVFDDEGVPFPAVCGNPQTGNLIPDMALAFFDGQNSSGTWTITIQDDAGGDIGTLNEWSVQITPGGGAACPAFGACCFSNNTCEIRTQSQCVALGGTYKGDGTNCTSCTGGCCLAGGCSVLTPSQCAATGGLYRGDGTTCTACAGACCQPNGCTLELQNTCTALNGVFLGLGNPCPGPTVFAASPNMPIADLGTVTHTITVPAAQGVVITDLDVDLAVTHTFVGDLIVTLSHNGGPARTLWSRHCGLSDNFNLIFDDEGVPIPGTCPNNMTGNFIPFQSLNAFDGQNSAGTWTITVSDNAGLDVGTLNSWSLHVSPGGSSPCPGFGGCCTGESCVVTTQDRCSTAGGAYQGDGTSCTVPHGGAAAYYETFPGTPILDPPNPGFTSVINVPTGGSIADVDLDIKVTHTFLTDLYIELRHNTTTVVVFDNRCGGTDNMDILLDDEGTTFPATCGTANFVGTYKPNNPLSAFDGQNMAGAWTLFVRDEIGGDVGTLDRWSLHLLGAVSICNEVASCNAGGPYESDCRDAVINGASVVDAEGDAISYTWTSSNPNVTVSPASGTVPAGAGTRPIPPATATLASFVNPVGVTTTLTLTVEDVRGTSSCTATVTFDDDQPPVITCPADRDLGCLDSTDPSNTGTATATDNCSASTVTFATVQVPMFVQYNADTIINNGVLLIMDNTQSSLDDPAGGTTGPTNFSLLTQSAANAMPCATAAGLPNNGFFPATAFHPDVQLGYDNMDNGNNSRQFTANGQNVVVPVPLDTYSEVHVFATSGQGSHGMTVVATYDDATTQNLGSPTVADWFDDFAPTAAVYYLADGLDRARPTGVGCQDSNDAAIFGHRFATNPAKNLVSLTLTRVGGTTASRLTVFGITGLAQRTEDGPGGEVTYSDSTEPGSCVDNYDIVRTWTATDDFGNSSSCTQTIRVRDTDAPLISCPADVTVECDEPTDPSATGSATARDVCDPNPVITSSDAREDGPCPDTYRIVRTWTATDRCENASSCIQVISVEDTTPPAITCPANVTVECDAPNDPSATGSATATDNCHDAPTITSSDTIEEGDCAGRYVIVREWTATDACNNSSTCRQIITVVDTTPPVIDQQPSVGGAGCSFLWPPNHGYASYTLAELGLVAHDACSGVVTTVISSCNSSQPEDDSLDDSDATGDGHSFRDCVISADGQTVSLRPERSASCGIERSYRFTLAVTDGCGNTATSDAVEVCVWHDRGNEPPGPYRSDDDGTNQDTFRPGVNGTYSSGCGSGCDCAAP